MAFAIFAMWICFNLLCILIFFASISLLVWACLHLIETNVLVILTSLLFLCIYNSHTFKNNEYRLCLTASGNWNARPCVSPESMRSRYAGNGGVRITSGQIFVSVFFFSCRKKFSCSGVENHIRSVDWRPRECELAGRNNEDTRSAVLICQIKKRGGWGGGKPSPP